MDKQYFVLEFAHSVEGRAKRITVTYRSLLIVLGIFAVLSLSAFGMVSSYLRMSWQVANYNELRADFDRLRNRYQDLQRVSRQHSQQMASLETLASEMTVAYGIKRPAEPLVSVRSAPLTPSVKESLAEYNFLKAASYGGLSHRSPYTWQLHSQPSLWPVNGSVRSSFGTRSDPFSGEGIFHSGIDIATPIGSEVHATADGVVISTNWVNGYGRLLIIDHGNGLQTYYAHLARFLVVPGEEVRGNESVALSGSSGRSTGPHVHYEVRLAGTPVNPYKYMTRSLPFLAKVAKPAGSDFGL